MKRTAKLLIGAIALVLVVVVGGAWIALSSVDLEQVRTLVQNQVREATGRDLTLSGPIDLGISWTPSIKVEQVSFANAAWGSRPAMANLERFELQVALLPLLSGEVQVKRVVLVGADILLERGTDGAVNWSFDTGAPAADQGTDTVGTAGDSSGSSMTPKIESVIVETSRVTYKDAATGQEITLALDRAEVATAGANLAVEATGSYQDLPFELAGEVGGPAALGGENPFPLRLTGTVGGAEISIDGSIADLAGAPKPSFAFRVAGSDVAAFAPLAGTALPAMGPYDLAGTLTGEGSTWTVAGLTAKMGGSDLAGDATVTMGGERPRIEAKLSSTLLALADFGAAAQGGGEATEAGAEAETESTPAESPYVIPETPLPLDALKGVDAAVTVAIAKFVPQAGTEITDVAGTLALEAGALVLDPFTATYGGGTAAGRVALDGGAEPPTLTVAATVDDLDFGRLAAEQGLGDDVKGTMDVALDVAGRGGSPRAIASTLDGTAAVTAEDGVITNKLLAIVSAGLGDLLGPLFGGQKDTTLNCILVRFDMAGGVATSRSLLVDTSTFSLAGSGTVDLRDESLDLHFDTATRQAALVSLAVPFNVTGTLKNPQAAPDPLGAAKAAASLAGAAVDPTAVLGVLIATSPDSTAGSGCTQVEQKASEDSGAFGLPGVGGATGAVEDVIENVTEGNVGEAVEGAGEALEGAVEGATEGLQNLLGD